MAAGGGRHLRHELAPDGEFVAEVQRVEERAHQPEQHLQHPHDDRQLHLIRVRKGELVLGVVPAGVEAEGVGVAGAGAHERVGGPGALLLLPG